MGVTVRGGEGRERQIERQTGEEQRWRDKGEGTHGNNDITFQRLDRVTATSLSTV